MAQPIALPYGGLYGEELQKLIDQNPGPQADIGFNPTAPVQLDIAPKQQSLMDMNSQAIQQQQMAGNVPMEADPEPIIPESIKSLMPQQELPLSAPPIPPTGKQKPYQPKSMVDASYGADLDDKALADAIEYQKNMELITALGKSGANIGASIAGMGNVGAGKVDTSGYDAIANMGKAKVEGIKTRRAGKDDQAKREKMMLDLNNEKAMQDPNSPESAFFRQVLTQQYSKFGINIPQNLPATKLKELGLKIEPGEKKKFQNVTFEIPGKGPVIGRFDVGTGEIEISPVKGMEDMGPAVRGYAPKIDPRTGEMATTTELMGQNKKAEESLKDPKATESFEPNVLQRKLVMDERKNYLSRTEKRRQALASAGKLETVLANPDKLDMSAIKTQLPRLMGEVGSLNQMEQDAWTGAPDFYDRYNQKINTFINGTITKENVKELKNIVSQMKDETQKSIDAENKNSASMLQDMAKVPAAWTQKQLGQYYGEKSKLDSSDVRYVKGIKYIRNPQGGWVKAP